MQTYSTTSYSNYTNSTQTKYTNKKLIPINSNQILASDKSQALSQVLGYGVDKEGFFTSDFNESLNLSKEYKIHAKDIKDLAHELSKNKHFSNINLQQSLENISKIFNQIMPVSNQNSLSKEELQKLPLGFKYDRKSLKVLEIYNDISQIIKQDQSSDFFSKNTQNSFAFSSYQEHDTYLNIQKNVASYIQANGNISKAGIFLAFAKNQIKQNENGFLISGDTSISGKLMGFDSSLSKAQVKDLNDFIEKHSFLGVNNSVKSLEEGIAYMSKILDLFDSNLSIEDFKKEWQKLQNKQNSQDELQSLESIIENEKANLKGKQEDKENKTFIPIQAKSKNGTYEAVNTNELLQKLLENSFDEKDFLKMLFGGKVDHKEFKSLDIKA